MADALGSTWLDAARIELASWAITVTATSAQGQTATQTRNVVVAYSGVNLIVAIRGNPAWIKVWVDGELVGPQSGRVYAAGGTEHVHDLQMLLGLRLPALVRGDDRLSEEKLVTALGGTIDANSFRDSDGKLYLYYKNDGNRVGKVSQIWGQRLSDDGLKVVGTAVAERAMSARSAVSRVSFTARSFAISRAPAPARWRGRRQGS